MALNLDFEFEYQLLPVVAVVFVSPQTGARVEAEALIDTGAEGTLLDASIAVDLGIDLEVGDAVQIGGVGGTLGEARVADVEIFFSERPDLRAVVKAAFAPNVAADYGNLLGLNVLSFFDFALSHTNRLGYLGRAAPAQP